MRVYLPICDAGLPSIKKQDAQQRLYGMREVIMLVDDDEMVLDANRKILETLNYEVEDFSSSLRALEAFKENPKRFKLVLSDLSMPEMDGVRLITNIREIYPDVPAILITGYEDALHPDDLQGLHILRKPVSSADISLALRQELAIAH